MLFSQIQQAPCPDFGKVGKSLSLDPDLDESCGSVVACPPSVKMNMSVKGVKSMKSKTYYTIVLVYSSVSILNLIPVQSNLVYLKSLGLQILFQSIEALNHKYIYHMMSLLGVK